MITYDVTLIRVLNEGAVVLRWDSFTSSERQTIWTRARVRKQHKCCVSGVPIEVGELAFRPVNNADYRMKRIHDDVIQAAIKRGGFHVDSM